MTDYIKRENAKRAVWGCARDTGIDEAPFEYAEGLLEDVPAEDVAPVRRGRWIDGGLFKKPVCSECGEDCIGIHSFDYVLTNYCPNCGAKMYKE